MFWSMRCGDEEGVGRSECKMVKSAGQEAERELDHLDPVTGQSCCSSNSSSRRALTLQL